MDPKTLKQRIIFRRIIQVMVIAAIFIMAITRINHENDLFWQLKMGEDIFKFHFFPIHDPYNLSNPGAVWTLEEWLVSVLFYVVYTALGAPGLIILKGVVVSATFLLFMLLFNKLKVNLYLSMIVLILAAMVNTRGIWGVFPSIFEYLFIVATVFILEYYLQNRKAWIPFLLGGLSFLWVQCHGSFFLFTGIVGAYLFGDIAVSFIAKRFPKYKPFWGILDKNQRKSLLIVFLLSLVFPLIHPNGYWMFIYPFRITFGPFTSYVSEYQKFWQVWNWDWEDFVHGFSFLLMAGLGVVFLFARKKIHIRDIILAGLFTLLALTAVRHVAVFALVALFIISKYLTIWFGEYRGFFKRTFLKDVLVIIFIVCFIVFYKLNIAPFGFVLSEDGYPKDAAELINASGIKGNMFNHYNYGGYLIWKMPQYQVFIDGRLEMYEGQAGIDYQNLLTAKEGYKDLLKKYNINFFINYLGDPINEQLYQNPDWKYVYHDQQYVVFVKNSLENKDFLDKVWTAKKEEDFRKLYGLSIARYKAEFFLGVGNGLLKKKDYKGATEAFTKAVYIDPTYIEARMQLAQMYLLYDMIEPAINEYKEVLKIDPRYSPAQRGLSALEVYYGKVKIK